MSAFSGKVALVTGAGRGLGRALALGLAVEGAIVALNDLTPVNLDETEALIRAAGGQARSYLGDAAQKMVVQGILTQIIDDYGRLDIAVNNAAVQPRAGLLELDEWDWRRALEVNLSAPFFVTQAAGRVLRELGGGVILNIGDALLETPGVRAGAAYQAGKAGLLGLTRAAAAELAPYGIRVNALCPGLLATESTRERWGEELPAGALCSLEQTVRQALRLCNPGVPGMGVSGTGGESSGQIIVWTGKSWQAVK